MRIQIINHLDDLAADTRTVATTTKARMATVVRKNAVEANRTTARIARVSSGSHGKLYPRSFSAEAITPLWWEYGPDADMPQGGMSFNSGSRNQPPHLDIEKGLDIQRPKFYRDISEEADDLFWPES